MWSISALYSRTSALRSSVVLLFCLAFGQLPPLLFTPSRLRNFLVCNIFQMIWGTMSIFVPVHLQCQVMGIMEVVMVVVHMVDDVVGMVQVVMVMVMVQMMMMM
jgi:hypothetical protein